MKNILKKIGIFISVVFSSMYLLAVIETEVQLDNYQKGFILCYLVFIFTLLVLFIKNKGIGKSDKKSIIVVLALSLLICLFGKDILIPRKYEDKIVEIIATGEKSEFSVSYEVWILSIIVNGNKVEFEDIALMNNWEIKDNCLASKAGESVNLLELYINEMESIEINFGKHDWSGIVEVKCGNEIERIDLYSDNGGGETVNISGEYKKIGIEKIWLLYGNYIAVFIGLSFFLSVFEWKRKYRWKRIAINQIIFAIMINSKLQGFFTVETIYISIILITIVNFLFDDIKNSNIMQPYFTKKSKIWIAILDLYITFAIIGHFLFINTDNVVVDVPRVIVFILGFLLFYPQIIGFIYFLKLIENKGNIYKGEKKLISLKRFKIQCFFIMIIPLIIISLGYYPGSMASDGVDQWAQAVGVTNISNAHPAIHTLFLKACSKIIETPYVVVIVQIVGFVLIWTLLFGFLYEKGLNSKLLYMIALLIVCMPNNYMMLCLVSKNIFYALIVLWNMYLLMKLLDNSKKFFTWRRIIEFSIALALLNTVRHNGFLGTYIIWIILIIWGIHDKKILKYKPFLIVAFSWIMILGIKGPLYHYFDVQGVEKSGSVSSVKVPLLTPAGMYILADESIPEEGMKIVKKIGSIEDWKENYNPYNGDKIGWGKLRNNILECSQSEAFRLYFILLKDNPLLVIKDRLNGIDILWNVIQPSATYNKYNVYNARYSVGIWPPEWAVKKLPVLLKEEIRKENGAYFNENRLTVLGNIGVKGSIRHQLLDVIFWRNGIYLILGMLLVFVNYIEKRGRINIVIFPAFATLCTLALAASWQIYQYYWFFSLSVIYFGLFTCFGNIKNKVNLKVRKINKNYK